jgi:hypothetical protein
MLFLPALLHAQTWSKRYDWNGDEMSETAKNIENTSNGYIVGTVGYNPDLPGARRVGFIQLDEEGEVLNEEVIATDTASYFLGAYNSGSPGMSGEYLVCGTISGFSSTTKARLISYNESGDTLWTIVYGDVDKTATFQHAIRSADGNIIAAGQSDDFPTASTNGYCILLVKFNPQGEVLWEKYIVEPLKYQVAFGVAELPNGNIAISGIRKDWDASSLEGADLLMLVTDSEGNELWAQTYGNERDDFWGFCSVLENGDILLHGANSVPDSENGKWLYAVRLNPENGDIIWEHRFISLRSSNLIWNKSIELPNGDIVLSGFVLRANQEGLPREYYALGKLSAEGDSLWVRKYEWDDGNEQASGHSSDMTTTPDGGFILAGDAWGSENYSQDVWVLKLDEFGCLIPGCQFVNVEEQGIESAIRIYPNPVGEVLSIEVQSLRSGNAQLKITNMQGEVVKSLRPFLIDNQGSLTLSTDASNLAAGIYLVQLFIDGELKLTEKMVKG